MTFMSKGDRYTAVSSYVIYFIFIRAEIPGVALDSR
jgi:hypothetical protein